MGILEGICLAVWGVFAGFMFAAGIKDGSKVLPAVVLSLAWPLLLLTLLSTLCIERLISIKRKG